MALVTSLLAVGAAVLVVVGGIVLYRYVGDDGGNVASDLTSSSGSTPSHGSSGSSGRSSSSGSSGRSRSSHGSDGGASADAASQSPSPPDASSSSGGGETAVAKEYLGDPDGGGGSADGETEVADQYLDGPDGADGASSGSTDRTKTCAACGTGIDKTTSVCPACDAIIWSDCDVLLDGDGMAVELDDGETGGRAIRKALSRAGVPEDDALRVSAEHLVFRTCGSGIEVRNCTTAASALELDGRALEPDAWTPVADGQRLTVAGQFDFTVRLPK
jgi:hypothetical protein